MANEYSRRALTYKDFEFDDRISEYSLSRVFRGKFTAGLKRAFRKGQLVFSGSLQPLENERAFRSFLRSLFRQDWVVYAKPPFGGPQHVLHRLARYTDRVAVSNLRIVNFAHGQVTFRWKDYAHGSESRNWITKPLAVTGH